MTKDQEDSLLNNPKPAKSYSDAVACNLPCDYCGDKPAHWFGRMSVAVCFRSSCQHQAVEDWSETKRFVDSQYDDEN